MVKKHIKNKDSEWAKKVREAQKDPQFRREIRKFIKITTGSYKLKDYGLENL